jgi:hypothetical protein
VTKSRLQGFEVGNWDLGLWSRLWCRVQDVGCRVWSGREFRGFGIAG